MKLKQQYFEILVKQGCTYEEAVEYFDFNTLGSWMGEGTPCLATLAKDMD